MLSYLLEAFSKLFNYPAAPDLPSASATPELDFLDAALDGNLNKIRELLPSGIDINTRNEKGMTALHIAASEGHMEVVEELIRSGAPIDGKNNKESTSLHVASFTGHLNIVTYLIEHGANVNAQTFLGYTPLYFAAQEGCIDIVKYLLCHGANQQLSSSGDLKALHIAQYEGYSEIAGILLDHEKLQKASGVQHSSQLPVQATSTVTPKKNPKPYMAKKPQYSPRQLDAFYMFGSSPESAPSTDHSDFEDSEGIVSSEDDADNESTQIYDDEFDYEIVN